MVEYKVFEEANCFRKESSVDIGAQNGVTGDVVEAGEGAKGEQGFAKSAEMGVDLDQIRRREWGLAVDE